MNKYLHEIGKRLQAQDNRCTANPMFCVQVRQREYGYDLNYTEDYVWLDPDDRESGAQPAPEDEDDTTLEKCGYRDFWQTVMVAFTEEGCKEHLRLNGHNYRHYQETRIYVESFNRCPEMIAIRAFLMEEPQCAG